MPSKLILQLKSGVGPSGILDLGDRCPENCEVSFGLSTRGHQVVYVDKHKFIKHERYKNRTRWTCSKRLQFGCKANLTTCENQMVRSVLQHNHD